LRTRAVFFDLGGTLMVMRRDRIISRILSDAGYPTEPARVHSAYFKAEPSWIAFYGERRMTGEDTEEAYRQLDVRIIRILFPGRPAKEVDRLSRLTRRQWPMVAKSVPLELYPDATPTLGRLKAEGYILGLISNAPPDTTKAIESLGLPRYLPIIIVSGVVGVSKPNPEIFRIALREAKVEAAEAAHIGDVYEADVLGARNAGMTAVLIDRDGSQASHDCPRVRSLTGIYPYIR
jgi:HAD superfamily hydrolase (TIGR01549 family)